MSKKVLVAVADGSEELEAVAIIDILRRAGAEVTVASVGSLQITASRGVKIVADCTVADCKAQTYDLIALPGGMPGAKYLRDCPDLIAMLTEQADSGRLYGAICAAPVVTLQPHGLLKGKRATCHPSRVQDLENRDAADQAVVVDGHCITGRGPGTAVAFALQLVKALYGRDKMEEVAGPLAI